MIFELDIFAIPAANPILAAWWFFTNGGWMAVLVAALYAGWRWWLTDRQHKYTHEVRYILLAIDVPKTTDQGPVAVEQIFATLAGTYKLGTLYHRYWQGRTQETFSFEIVSLGGYIQFLIRTPADFRDLVEASVYAQYPDAEITEVEDYVHRIAVNFDTADYDLWGTEFQLKNKDCYPIRMYNDFKNELNIEDQFKDPMASLLEIMGRINNDEDIWLQILVTSSDDHWQHQGQREVKRIIENRNHSRDSWWEKILFKFPLKFMDWASEAIIPLWGDVKGHEAVIEPGTVQKLSPGQKKVVEAIEHKMSKIGFHVKMRMIYWGRREAFLKGRGVMAVVGAIQQFTALNLNGLVPADRMTTKAEYFLKQWRINRRKRRILRHYQSRTTHRGMGHGFILNIEELATLYHFPVTAVKAPLVKKAAVKKAEPPFALPIYQPGMVKATVDTAAGARAGVKGAPPVNLPFVD
ncbi:MAG: hypothetical protein WC621_05585 [Patescibacteria group bacterium]